MKKLSALLFCLVATALHASVQYKVERGALAALSAPHAIGAKVKTGVIPIDGEPAALELERFEVFAKDADIKVLGAHDEVLEVLAPPAVRYYRGAIAGQKDSFAFISVAGLRVDGVVFKGERRFGIGSRLRPHRQAAREGDGVDVFIQEAEPVDDIPQDGRGFTCDVERAGISPKPSLADVVSDLRHGEETNGALSTASARWVINMAVETDDELYVNAGSNSSNVTTFIGNLIGAMSTIYNRELTAEVVVSSLTINTGADSFTVVPGAAGTWNSAPVTYTTSHALYEFGDRWHNNPPSAMPRSTTALISGKSQLAGVAWIDVLCDGDFLCGNCGDSAAVGHYGGRYSYNGGIDPPNDNSVVNPDANAPIYTVPGSNYWPLLELAHETGHNVRSGHTHCKLLSAPDQTLYGRSYVDQCVTQGGCNTSGPSVPVEKGTIMSYCHLSGPSNTRFIFGKTGEASYVMTDELKAAIQSATPNLSAITAPAALASGASGTASVTNVGGLTYLWTVTNGVINSGQGTSSINFTANANPTNVRIKATNSAGCSITDNKDVTVTSSLYDPPALVTATATTATSVSISWVAPGGTPPVQYDIYRSTNGVNYTQINFVTHPTTGYVDATALANTAYLYKVRSAGAAGANESADSNRDLATTVIFTDDPLVVGTTASKVTHIDELRTAVNALRAAASLGGGSYTDPTLTAFVTNVKAAHITDLRTALDAARTALSLSAISYGETLAAGVTTIKASHINELRDGVK